MWSTCQWLQSDECNRRPCMCEYCELILPAENHAEHVEYCGSRTESCALCGRFVKLRDCKLHEESNCTMPPVVTPPAPSSSDDFLCDGMDAYRLSQLDHFLYHDVTGNHYWASGPYADLGRSSQFSRIPPAAVGRMNLRSHGFVTRNRPGQLMDSRDGVQAAGPKNSDSFAYRPKVMNGSQNGNSASVPSSDDAGNSSIKQLYCAVLVVVTADGDFLDTTYIDHT